MGYSPQFNAYQMRFHYQVDGLSHVINAYCVPEDFSRIPGQAPSVYGIMTHAGGVVGFDYAGNALWDGIDGIYCSADAQFNYAELWKTPADTQNWQFLTSLPASTPPSNVGAYKKADMGTMTFRTVGGHIMKLVYHEPVSRNYGKYVLDIVTPTTLYDAVAAHIVHSGSVYTDRYGTAPFVPIYNRHSQNEAVFRKRFY